MDKIPVLENKNNIYEILELEKKQRFFYAKNYEDACNQIQAILDKYITEDSEKDGIYKYWHDISISLVKLNLIDFKKRLLIVIYIY